MSEQANERAFEVRVEETLLGRGGWRAGTNAEWDVDRALFPARVIAFLAATQPRLWGEMRGLHGAALDDLAVKALAKELDLKGMLHVLRHGFKFYGKTFRMAWFKPAHGLNEEVQALYAQKISRSPARYVVTRAGTTRSIWSSPSMACPSPPASSRTRARGRAGATR